MYANGWGVPQSDDEAFKWYSLAAEQGVIEAQNAVAKMYFGGFGAPQSNVQAHKWYNIAAELGDLNAASKRDDLVPKLSPEELAEAKGLAVPGWRITRRCTRTSNGQSGGNAAS